MMNDYSYRTEQRMIYLEKTRDLLDELPSYVSSYINAKLSSEKFQPKTAFAYTGDIKYFFDYLTLKNPLFDGKIAKNITLNDLENLTCDDISDYLAFLSSYKDKNGKIVENSASSKARKLASIRGLYNYLVKKRSISNNPCSAVDTPTSKEKPIITLDPAEKERLYDTFRTGQGLTKRQQAIHDHQKWRNEVIFDLFNSTGMRVSELVGVDMDDINEITKSIMITRKGNKIQNIYLDDDMLYELQMYIKECRPLFYPVDTERALFLNREGSRIGVRSIEKMIKTYSKAAIGVGKKITPHKLRSTFGTDLYKESGDIYLVADALGHSNVDTTSKHYAKMGEEHRRKVASFSQGFRRTISKKNFF